MVTFIRLTLVAGVVSVLFNGCSAYKDIEPKPRVEKNVIQQFEDEIAGQKAKGKASLPPLVLPPVYQEASLLKNNKQLTFSAIEAPLSKVLFIISKETGLNLVISESVDVEKKVSLNFNKASLQDVLEVTMDVSNTYFEIKGNILYIKRLQTKSFELPFINAKSSIESELGGDLLGSTGGADSGLSGDYSLSYESDDDTSDFYKQLSDAVKDTLSEDGKYSLNRFTGTLIVTDYRSNIKQIESMFESIKKFLSKQVLIEAKIMEVVLNDDHQLGVNWQKAWESVNDTVFAGQALGGIAGTFAGAAGQSLGNPITNSGTSFSLAYTRGNFEAVIQAMQGSGDVEVVSNPRLKVLNGQQGMLASGNMVPYWNKTINYVSTTDANGNQITRPEATYTKTDVLNGVSLGVTPIIKKDGTILLNIVPVVTNIEGEKTFTDAGNEVARAPIINVKEAGTTVFTKDNSLIVIGGLISSTKRDSSYKTPGLSEIPALGNLFKRREQAMERRELVIVLKINIEDNQL